ncbi:uncharacterized protein LOC113329617 [Papaver somniferum]|uniref:uncharacterized protein LOC113329617 n=1 Tax=Papaver somniferum TaxID=3469 RepID=UPI000E70547A|nr:uncharacterized protein LOC113329617 [Papaver somniferum]
MCKYFAASLVGEALKWFEGILVESIGSFHHLQNVFLGQYISNNMSRPGIETAFGLRRRTNETLRHPTTRWRTMCSEIGRRVDEQQLILAFINALFATDLLYTQIFQIKDTITMSELREFQEEYIALEEKQRYMESYPVGIPDAKGGNASLLPRLTNTFVSTSQGNKGRNVADMEEKRVAMGSADQTEFEKQHQNRGGTDTIQPGSSGGPQTHYNKKTRKIVWEQINLPKLNTTVDKIWEAAILMEDIPEPDNTGDEPPPGRRSKEFCVYHRFHGHTTSNCRNVRKIILRMIEQEKLNHFLAQPKNLPPPPRRGNEYGADNGKNVHIVEVGAKSKNLYCNSIIHSFKNIEDFHDNILSRVYTRDVEGKENLNLVKVSPLKEWQKKVISFKDDEEDETNTWAMNRILIDIGSSVDILFYHTYKIMGGRDDELIPSTYKIYGFNGAANKPKGEVTKGIRLQNLSTDIVFCVVDVESPYNALIGRPWLHSILGVASTFHQCIKFTLPNGIGIIRGDIFESRNCQEIDIDKCEEGESKQRNWKQCIAESQRADKLILKAVYKVEECTNFCRN